jgi:hypothetical protein
MNTIEPPSLPGRCNVFTYEYKLPAQHSLKHSSTLESISLCHSVSHIDRHDWSIDDNKKRHDYKDTNVMNKSIYYSVISGLKPLFTENLMEKYSFLTLKAQIK